MVAKRTDQQVGHNPDLLAALIADEKQQSNLYRPTAYWRPYAQRIITEIGRRGLADFRTNQVILKGYAHGGTATPAMPASPVKRAVWKSLSAAPGVRTILREHERLIAALSGQLRRTQVAHARAVMDAIAAVFPNLCVPEGLTNGGADDVFSWRGHDVSADFVQYLARAADFYAQVPAETVTAILEIGPGLGHSTLAHVALNPNLKIAVNADIVPVIYVSSRFLASSPTVEVIDYIPMRGSTRIKLETGTKPRIYSMPVWMLPRVEGNVDFAFNAFSFQEMEEDVCRHYADHMKRLARRGVMLHSSITGHKPKAGGQTKPVTMEFLKGLFSLGFRQNGTVAGIWTDLYDVPPDVTVLFRQ